MFGEVSRLIIAPLEPSAEFNYPLNQHRGQRTETSLMVLSVSPRLYGKNSPTPQPITGIANSPPMF